MLKVSIKAPTDFVQGHMGWFETLVAMPSCRVAGVVSQLHPSAASAQAPGSGQIHLVGLCLILWKRETSMVCK